MRKSVCWAVGIPPVCFAVIFATGNFMGVYLQLFKKKGTFMRTSQISRKTKETDISVTLSLGGSGKAEIDTGIGFFDHMLTALAVHGGFDLTVRCAGI